MMRPFLGQFNYSEIRSSVHIGNGVVFALRGRSAALGASSGTLIFRALSTPYLWFDSLISRRAGVLDASSSTLRFPPDRPWALPWRPAIKIYEENCHVQCRTGPGWSAGR